MGQARNRGSYEQRVQEAKARQATLREQMEDARTLAQALLTPEEKERRRRASTRLAAILGFAGVAR
jgi:hypothetical protein